MTVIDVLREELEQQMSEASRDADTKVDPTKGLRSIRLDLAEQMQGRPKGN